MSNHHDDPWETEMSRTFDQRVRDLHEAPLTLDHVKGKARRIRRTRQIAGAAAGLAAAAVIVPLAVLAGQGLTDQDSGPDPAPDPTVSDHCSPGFCYLEGRSLHLADGSEIELPERYERFTMLGDTVLAVRNDDDTGQHALDVIDESGTTTETVDVQSDPVIDDDLTTVAYIDLDGDLVVRWDGGERVHASGLDQNAFARAITGCGEGGDGCRVYVDDGAGGAPTVFDEDGNARALAPDALGVEDASEDGLVTVQNKSQIEGSCGGVYDETVGDYLWETCDHYLFDLSPDSRYVNATHPYLDGLGNAYAEILDARTGKPTGARFEPEQGFIAQTVWQDAEHLLLTMHDAGGWSIFRLGVDGTTEQVAGPSSKGNDTTPAYVLPGGP